MATNISIDKKTDAVISFQYYDSDGTTPRSLVGCTLLFTVKENSYDADADDSEASIYKTVTSHTTPATGLSAIELTDTDTDITPKTYFYDVKVKESDNKIYLAQSGRLTINPSVTNRIV
jgi:hypothetical protein